MTLYSLTSVIKYVNRADEEEQVEAKEEEGEEKKKKKKTMIKLIVLEGDNCTPLLALLIFNYYCTFLVSCSFFLSSNSTALQFAFRV